MYGNRRAGSSFCRQPAIYAAKQLHVCFGSSSVTAGMIQLDAYRIALWAMNQLNKHKAAFLQCHFFHEAADSLIKTIRSRNAKPILLLLQA
ncbi:hypothetical protein D3C72_2379920 [compost metagenome]